MMKGDQLQHWFRPHFFRAGGLCLGQEFDDFIKFCEDRRRNAAPAAPVKCDSSVWDGSLETIQASTLKWCKPQLLKNSTSKGEEFPRIRSQNVADHLDHLRTPERQFIWDCCRLMDLRSLGNRSDVNQSRVHGPLSPHICKYISTLSKWQEVGRLILLVLHTATAKS